MRKFILSIVAVMVMSACEKPVEDSIQNEPQLKSAKTCVTIQSGKLKDSNGNVITTGYMATGYNYQAHIYNGEYTPGWNLVMKWNDAWLSNSDCDLDGKLDRPANYKGSGAWCTNHWTSIYTNDEGKKCAYEEFTKIVAVPLDAYIKDGMYHNADGTVIGQPIWGSFAIIESIINDPCANIHGVQYKSPDHAGLGNW
jgi:hypothetical protein